MRALSLMAALVSFTMADDQYPPVDPKSANCMNWDAYWYMSYDVNCNTVWEEWDEYCMYYAVPDNCIDIEYEMQMIPWVMKPDKIIDKEIKRKKIALLKATEEIEAP